MKKIGAQTFVDKEASERSNVDLIALAKRDVFLELAEEIAKYIPAEVVEQRNGLISVSAIAYIGRKDEVRIMTLPGIGPVGPIEVVEPTVTTPVWKEGEEEIDKRVEELIRVAVRKIKRGGWVH